ncbi:hypothetical protein CDAR_572501 [Caerostris darwini]|uniref:Uncharacterized protein n=1 Tax=Caerostris darwini TaxID=1538125 RepID=A0AAV4PCT5_9ARAC|nr:hypothetical protein CDAR_572501 [Caerostris darwini]
MDAGLVTAKTLKASAATVKKAEEGVIAAEDQMGHLAAWRGCPKFPKPRLPPNRTAAPPRSTFVSRTVKPGVSYASFLHGPPPATPSVIPERPNIWDNVDPDKAAKTAYVFQEVSSILDMLGDIDNFYNQLKSAKSPMEKFQIIAKCFNFAV